MFKMFDACVFVLVPVFFMQTANAFFDAPWIAPTAPIAGESIAVNIRAGICDAIVGTPGYPQITQDGSSIRILLWAVRYEDPELCFLGVGTATYDIGAYPSGVYLLQVDIFYYDGFANPRIETIGLVPFVVRGSQVAAAPVTLNSPAALILIALCLATIGLAFFKAVRPRET